MKITDLFKHAKRPERFSRFVQNLSDDELRSLIKERGWKLGRGRGTRQRWETKVENLLAEIHSRIY